MKMFLVALLMMVLAVSTMKGVAAADAPAPSPTSDASVFLPTLFASGAAAVAFGFLF